MLSDLFKMSCDVPCTPCCKYGGYREIPEQSLKQPQIKDTLCQAICNDSSSEEPNSGLQISKNISPLEDNFGPVPTGDVPCYLPQLEDLPGRQVATDEPHTMGPIGPWATGRVDWGPLAGMTGTRPVVTQYSITRYSEGEWRKRNDDLFNDNYMQQHRANIVGYTSQQCLEKTRADTDTMQASNTKKIEQRASDIHRWKCELERAIEAAIEELNLLTEQHIRLKQAMSILTIPTAIAAECIEIRSTRLEPDLVRDEVEEELIKELALTAEIKDTFNRTLTDIVHQITEEKAAKQRLEFDWSDKKQGHEIERLNSILNNRSTTIFFKPGATRLPDDQSTSEYWEHFTRESLYQSEMTRQKALAFRGTLDAILINAARDLRSQADRVEEALAKRVACLEELRIKLEQELKKVLEQLVNTEKVIERLQEAIRNMDFPMKVAQTRLDNKLTRPRVENCREISTLALIDEVKKIAESVAALSAELKQAEDCKTKLLETRGAIERELMIKLKNLWIDKERIQFLRSHYPSATALSGH